MGVVYYREYSSRPPPLSSTWGGPSKERVEGAPYGSFCSLVPRLNHRLALVVLAGLQVLRRFGSASTTMKSIGADYEFAT